MLNVKTVVYKEGYAAVSAWCITPSKGKLWSRKI